MEPRGFGGRNNKTSGLPKSFVNENANKPLNQDNFIEDVMRIFIFYRSYNYLSFLL